MKLFSALIVMVVLIVSLGLWINHSLELAAQELTHHLDQVIREVNRSDWPQANNHVEAMERDWKQIGKWWPVFMNHQEIDNIEFSLAKAKEYIVSKDKVESLAQLSELRLMILHLPKKEAITLENIL